MRTRQYDGHRFLVSFTKRVREIMDANVGVGKRFPRKSDLINYCIIQVLGSERQKTENEEGRVASQLQAKLDELEKLRKKHPFAEGKSRVLAHCYSIAADRAVELAERAQADWKEHYDRCEDCAISCRKANESGACWRMDVKDQIHIAWFASEDAILSDLLAAVDISKLKAEVDKLKLELKQESSRKKGETVSQTSNGKYRVDVKVEK